MKNHKDLDVWKQSMLLAEQIYSLTKDFPTDEKYGLISQMKRAVISIPSNIAEGAARKGNKEFVQFMYIAMGSLSELETQILLSQRLQFVNSVDNYLDQIEKIKQMLFGLIRYISKRDS
jgi:four helix bundle protein